MPTDQWLEWFFGARWLVTVTECEGVVYIKAEKVEEILECER